MHDDQLVQRIASALRVFGRDRDNQNAADAEIGVRDWWLEGFEPRPTIAQVTRALELLGREGSFVRETLDDGGHVWRPVKRP